MPPQSRKSLISIHGMQNGIRINLMYIKSRACVAMEAIAESLCSYNDKDFLL